MIHLRLLSVPLCFFMIFMMPLLSYAEHDDKYAKDNKTETTTIETPTLQESLKIIKEAHQNDIEQAIFEVGDTPIEALSEELRSWFQSAGFASDLTLRQALEKLQEVSDKPLTSEKAVQNTLKTVMSDPQLMPVKLTVETHQDSDSDLAPSSTGALSLFHSGLGSLLFSVNAQTLTPFLSFMAFLTQLAPSTATNTSSTPTETLIKTSTAIVSGSNSISRTVTDGLTSASATVSNIVSSASATITGGFTNISANISANASTDGASVLTELAARSSILPNPTSPSRTTLASTDDNSFATYLISTVVVVAVVSVLVIAVCIYRNKFYRKSHRFEIYRSSPDTVEPAQAELDPMVEDTKL